MDVDKQIRKIQNENVGSLNAESFIKKEIKILCDLLKESVHLDRYVL